MAYFLVDKVPLITVGYAKGTSFLPESLSSEAVLPRGVLTHGGTAASARTAECGHELPARNSTCTESRVAGNCSLCTVHAVILGSLVHQYIICDAVFRH